MPKDLVTTPTIGSRGGVVGRPRTPVPHHTVSIPVETLPQDAADLIEVLAADGWSKAGIAWKLGTSKETLSRWFTEAPALQEAYEVGRERERHTLHNTAFRMSQDDKLEPAVRLRATMYLLNTRHGYAEPSNDSGGRVNVTILNLPATRPLADYIDVGAET